MCHFISPFLKALLPDTSNNSSIDIKSQEKKSFFLFFFTLYNINNFFIEFFLFFGIFNNVL